MHRLPTFGQAGVLGVRPAEPMGTCRTSGVEVQAHSAKGEYCSLRCLGALRGC